MRSTFKNLILGAWIGHASPYALVYLGSGACDECEGGVIWFYVGGGCERILIGTGKCYPRYLGRENTHNCEKHDDPRVVGYGAMQSLLHVTVLSITAILVGGPVLVRATTQGEDSGALSCEGLGHRADAGPGAPQRNHDSISICLPMAMKAAAFDRGDFGRSPSYG
jgi:hypothetical protein